MNISTMGQIQDEKQKEMTGALPPLDPEGKALAGDKRKTFDIPTNAVKVDPLR